MLIANPIYDVVFKRLMENEKVAKFFIGTMLNSEILSVEVRPQEFTYLKEEAFSVFRLDFIAVIRTESGETEKVLIEIQKAGKEVDLMRFRNYLGEQYKKQETADGKERALPIKTIYILGFKLPTIDSACIHIERNYRDMLTNELIAKKSEFVEKLTHDSYVVQVERIGGKFRTKLEKLLSLFEQSHFVNETATIKDYPYEVEGEELKLMTGILHHTGADAQTRKEIEDEREAWRVVNDMFADREHELQGEIEKRDKALSEKDRALSEKDKALSEKDGTISAKEAELEKQRKEIEELKRKLKEN